MGNDERDLCGSLFVYHGDMKEKQEQNFIVIGGGASGLTAAIAAGRAAAAHHRFVRIIVLEASRRIGHSILRSGNGRCNFSRLAIDAGSYHSSSFVRRAFDALDADGDIPSVLDWFSDLGLVWTCRHEDGGLLYPYSNKSSSVLDVLRFALDALAVEVRVETSVAGVEKQGSRYRVVLDDATTLDADAVFVGVGGRISSRLLKQVSFVESRPVLGALKTDTTNLKGMNGTRVRAKVALPDRGIVETGEVLFREYGVSGIAVFNISRHARKGDRLTIDLVPDRTHDELEHFLEDRFVRLKPCATLDFLRGFLLEPVALAVLRSAGLPPAVPFGQHLIGSLVYALKNFSLRVEGIADPGNCQVHRGGIAVDHVEPSTMEVIASPGLYVMGEALDVDGPCGGYNLHWAWTSGLLAGNAAVRRLPDEGRRS